MKIKLLLGMALVALNYCAKSGDDAAANATASAGTAQWLQIPTPVGGQISFAAVATDAAGNAYVVGSQTGTGACQYGSGITATGTYSGSNVLLVKYNSSGNAQWARTVTAGTNASVFNGVAVDSAGNIYAVGSQTGNAAFSYAAGVSATGTYNLGQNVVIVKYNAAGDAQWARTVTAGTNVSGFSSVAVDASGNAYAVGSQSQNGTFTFAAGVSAVGSASAATNALIVKYDTNGNALWARTVTAGTNNSGFAGVGVDSSGNAYAAGTQGTNGTYTYSAGVSATGVSVSGSNLVIVKYDTSGTAQWARAATAGSNQTGASAVAVDTSGNAYVAGYQTGNAAFTYGAGVSATAAVSGAFNALLVKYDSSGNAQWARTVTAGTSESRFFAVAIDTSGKITAGGNKLSENAFTYGTGVTVTGSALNYNTTLVQYDTAGSAQWGRSVSTGNNNSQFSGVAAGSSGNIYAVGYQYGTPTYTYGTGVSGAGTISTGNNAVVVQYR